MKDHLFKVHRELTEVDFKNIWKDAYFIFDANVLLDLYRLPETAKNDLLNVLQNSEFNKRIWIGFQVLLEFLNNRLNIVSEQKNMFNKVISLTQKHIEKLTELNNEYNSEILKLNLNQRHSTISPDNYLTKKKISKTSRVFKKFIEHLTEKEREHTDVNDVDELKDIIMKIFENKIGNPLNEDAVKNTIKEGEERYLDNIPPGYMDKQKEGYYIVNNLKFPRKYGDLFLWKEIMQYIGDNKLELVVLVTGDIKEDWWEEKRGRKIGPRKELLNEIYSNCNDLKFFHIYNTSTFLKYAKQEIDSEINDSSIEDTRKLISQNKKYDIRQKEISEIYARLEHTNNNIEEIKKQIESSEQNLHRATIYRNNLYADSNFEDDTREYAHNLGYLESEIENEIEFSKKKLSALYSYRALELTKLDLLKRQIE